MNIIHNYLDTQICRFTELKEYRYLLKDRYILEDPNTKRDELKMFIHLEKSVI